MINSNWISTYILNFTWTDVLHHHCLYGMTAVWRTFFSNPNSTHAFCSSSCHHSYKKFWRKWSEDATIFFLIEFASRGWTLRIYPRFGWSLLFSIFILGFSINVGKILLFCPGCRTSQARISYEMVKLQLVINSQQVEKKREKRKQPMQFFIAVSGCCCRTVNSVRMRLPGLCDLY